MNILLTGAEGQLGIEIKKLMPKNINFLYKTKTELDITNMANCKKLISTFKPDWVINAAAYTNVDKAEVEKERCFEVNCDGPRIISEILKDFGGRLLQISTDYVFDGESKKPYQEDSPLCPINKYGESKAYGEDAIRKIYGETNNYLILRTSWLMGPHKKNFLKTMLDFHAKKNEISVVSDQLGSLTSTSNLGKVCLKMIFNYEEVINKKKVSNIFHYCDEGIVSWHEIASEIGYIASEIGLIKNPAKVNPIKSSQFPTLAKRPFYSVLDTQKIHHLFEIEKVFWKDSLKRILIKILEQK